MFGFSLLLMALSLAQAQVDLDEDRDGVLDYQDACVHSYLKLKGFSYFQDGKNLGKIIDVAIEGRLSEEVTEIFKKITILQAQIKILSLKARHRDLFPAEQDELKTHKNTLLEIENKYHYISKSRKYSLILDNHGEDMKFTIADYLSENGCLVDQDRDAVPDLVDACPDIIGSPQFGGCSKLPQATPAVLAKNDLNKSNLNSDKLALKTPSPVKVSAGSNKELQEQILQELDTVKKLVNNYNDLIKDLKPDQLSAHHLDSLALFGDLFARKNRGISQMVGQLKQDSVENAVVEITPLQSPTPEEKPSGINFWLSLLYLLVLPLSIFLAFMSGFYYRRRRRNRNSKNA